MSEPNEHHAKNGTEYDPKECSEKFTETIYLKIKQQEVVKEQQDKGIKQKPCGTFFRKGWTDSTFKVFFGSSKS